MKCCAALCFLVFMVLGYPAIEAQKASGIDAAFQAFQHSPALRHAGIGFCVNNPDNGRILYAYNDSLSLAPASCMKIATTGAALAILGPGYRFHTEIAYTGSIDTTGTLFGNLLIIGGGDPTLGSPRSKGNIQLADMVHRITKAGIRHIHGKIVVVSQWFDQENICPAWAWNDIGNYFGAGVFSVNYAENEYTLALQAGNKPGEPVKLLTCQPGVPGLRFNNCLTTGTYGCGDQSNIYGAQTDSFRMLQGFIPPARQPFHIKGSMPLPAAALAGDLAASLYHAGILSDPQKWSLDDATSASSSPGITIVDTLWSPRLADIIYPTNMHSINLYAECMLKEAGKKVKNSGSWSAGISAIKQYWQKAGIDTIGLYMEDGSGLSRYDGISAAQLCGMLTVIRHQPFFDDFLHSLPVAGLSGSMRDLGKGTAMDGRIYCKTGHMERVRAYSGYIKTKTGNWLCFSLLVNNYPASAAGVYAAIEKLLVEIGE